MAEDKFVYEYALFMTGDGEVATGCSSGETPDEASAFLGSMLKDNLRVYFESNPNRVVSLVIQSYTPKEAEIVE